MKYYLAFILSLSFVYAQIDPGFTPEIHRVYRANEEMAQITFQKIPSNHGAQEDPVAVAVNFANLYYQEQVGDASIPSLSFLVKNAYESDTGVTHVYLRQIWNSYEIVNADMNINVLNSTVISFGSSFYHPKHADAALFKAVKAFINPLQALKSVSRFFNLNGGSDLMEVAVRPQGDQFLLENVSFAGNGKVPCRLAYLQKETGALELIWDLIVDTKSQDNWYNVQVSAATGRVVSFVDWVSRAVPRYAAYGFGVPSPLSKKGRTLFQNISDPIASPRNWQRIGNLIYLGTQGNNVRAQENYDGSFEWENKYRPNGGINQSFFFPLDLAKTPKQNQDAAITNLFVWNNLVHDIFYYYGFNEKSGNFQDENFGRGGADKDGVIANAMDGSGTNNANFATPPDGFRPRMRMYTWTLTQPNRDGDLESPIIIHEYGHGISTRLTGGPANSGCLGFGESGGLGEGWSDFFGLILHMKPEFNSSTVLLMGDYVYNGRSIRRYPYTTNKNINPETYGYIKRADYASPHSKGAIWAQTLLEAYWEFVKKYGFTSDWKKGTLGNTRILRDVVDALKLQPCRPTFIDARNAILQANNIRNQGKDICIWWRAFAKRGLGSQASASGNEDFSIPMQCVTQDDDKTAKDDEKNIVVLVDEPANPVLASAAAVHDVPSLFFY